MKRIKIKPKLPFVIAFFVPFFVLLVSYAVFGVWPFGDKSALVLDLNGQYVYFYEALKNALFGDGSIFYSWSRNLSGDFFGLVGYYLASPFSIIPVILPRAIITESILLMQACKIGTASVTFSYFLKKTGRADNLVSILFGVLYSLMAYISVEIMNPMWIDGAVYLPLIILGIEKLVKDKRILPFAIPMGLMLLANFYIGYMVGIFAVFYFIFFAISEDCLFNLKKAFDRLWRALLGGVIAVLIGALTIIPIIKVLSLGKLEFSTPTTFSPYAKFSVLEALGKLLPLSYDSVNVDGLPFIYCGLLTLLCFPLFFASKKVSLKKKLCFAFLVAVSFVLMYVSTFDLLMHGGQWPNWLNYRYSFVLSFLLLTLGADAFYNLDGIERKTVFKVYGVILAIIILFNTSWAYVSDTYALWFCVIALTLYAAILLIIKLKPDVKRVAIICTIVFVCCELVFNTFDNFKKIDDEVLYSTRDSYTDWYEEFSPVVNHIKQTDDSFYRMETTYHRTVNDNMALDIYGLSHSSSLMNTQILDFLSYMGYTSRGFESRYIGGTVLSDSLLGLKYVVAEWEDIDGNISPKNNLMVYEDLYRDVYSNGYVLHVYENPYALPIAFYADDSLFLTSFDSGNENNVFENQNQLLSNIVGEAGESYFVPANYETALNNVTCYDAVDQDRYVPSDATLSASIDFTIKSDIDGELYMFIPTNYHRGATVNYNGKVVSEYFAGDHHTALALGNVKAGDNNYVSLIMNESDLYMQTPQFYVLDKSKFNSAIDSIRTYKSDVTKNSTTSLTVDMVAPNSGYVFTSIPYEKGWSATVDGNRADCISVANGLLAIPVSAGEHVVKLHYISDGFVLGLMLFLIGVGACGFIIYLSKRKKEK